MVAMILKATHSQESKEVARDKARLLMKSSGK